MIALCLVASIKTKIRKSAGKGRFHRWEAELRPPHKAPGKGVFHALERSWEDALPG